MDISFPVGVDLFPKIREDKYYYIDKTGFIKELLGKQFEAYLVTRPRRFGKTLTMSMLEDFFDISRDSAAHFAGLEISRHPQLCGEWMNRWPVVFLTLKSVEGLDFRGAYGMLEVLVANLCKKYSFLADSAAVAEADRRLFGELMAQEAGEKNIKDSLNLLTRMMAAHYGRPAILLIDEYDVPLAKANENGYYAEMLDVIRAMLGAVKTNENLKFAVITGCLRIAKESIFTGINNLATDGIMGDHFQEYIGFTEAEVGRLFSDAGLSGHLAEAKAWYDGYRFGDVGVYCPWDVLNYAACLQSNPKARPKAFWANTSGNAILKRLLKKNSRTVRAEMEQLIAGESVTRKITEQLTYNELDRNEDSLWSVLYLTGYLTAKGMDGEGCVELVIPNREIREIFTTQVSEWFTEEITGGQRGKWDAFCAAMETGDAEGAEKLLTAFLNRGISIRDTAARKAKKEHFYHGMLLGLMMTRDEWDAYSNRETGDGYSDICVEAEDVAFVVEIKYAENGDLEAGCAAALDQIDGRRYAEEFMDYGYSKVYAYGIAFYKKRCKIAVKDISPGE